MYPICKVWNEGVPYGHIGLLYALRIKSGMWHLLFRCCWTCWAIIGHWQCCSMTVWSVTCRISVRCSSNLSLVMPRTCPLLSLSQVWSLLPWIMIFRINLYLYVFHRSHWLLLASFHSVWLGYRLHILIDFSVVWCVTKKRCTFYYSTENWSWIVVLKFDKNDLIYQVWFIAWTPGLINC